MEVRRVKAFVLNITGKEKANQLGLALQYQEKEGL
jgi:hypothetical protein